MGKTAIVNARVFDGVDVVDATTVVIDGSQIASVGGAVPPEARVVDAAGSFLLPGLIDSHVHTSIEGLELALTFGVTTELEMQGVFTKGMRAEVTSRTKSPAMNLSPTATSRLSSPSMTRFSPNVPYSSLRPSSFDHQSSVSEPST